MKIPRLLRAATAVLLALGMTSVGAAAAFADDTVPPADPATQSAPPAESSDPPSDPAPDPSAQPPASDPAPDSSDPADDATPGDGTTAQDTGVAPAADTKPATKPAARLTARSLVADPTPYVLLAWQLPCGVADPWCPPGQNLVYHLDLASPSLDALDASIVGTCSDWQVDLENDSATTTSLIAAGILTGPNTPPEDHAYGALGANVNPWKYVDNPDCNVGTSVTPAATATDQSCQQNANLVGGSIQVSLMTGVTYTITDSSATVVPFDSTTGLTGALPPGNYSVSFVLDTGYTTVVPSPIPLTIAAYTGPCGVSVTPAASATDQDCLRSVLLVDGHIQVSIQTGVHYTITDSSATVVPFDTTTGLTAGLAPGSYSVAFSLDAGYVTAVTSPIPLTITAFDGACAPISVTPAATSTPETCVDGVFLTGGSIQLALMAGVTYTITDSSAAVVPFDPATGLTGPLPAGAYSVAFSLDPLYTTAVVSPIGLFISSYDGPCDLPTDALVTPLVSYTAPTCTSGGSYTLGNDLGIPAAVTWMVNGSAHSAGTFPAPTGSTVTIEAAPESPGYGFDAGQQTVWTHTFTMIGSGCALTLAFTGSTPQQLGWIAAVLTVSGLLVMRIRARMHSRRPAA
ncbi:MAG TPA: hypothetical protein VGO65_05770 [Pseudolysinimonas sp.]|nr:hypothetical protein [Pseudolysinimonas sp.]